MAFITPKTDWIAADGVGAADMNRIEGNEVDLDTRVTAASQRVTDTLIVATNTVVATAAFVKYYGPTFSASSTYAVGDLVIYATVLYKCIVAITVPAAWNASKWEAQPTPLAQEADLFTKNYNFRAPMVIAGVTADYSADVVFGIINAEESNYAGITNTGNATVYIYAKAVPLAAITIPTIKCLKEV